MFPSLFNVFFAAPIEATVWRFSEDEVGAREGGEGSWVETLLDEVQRAVWVELYAEIACVVSKSTDGLARMMAIIVEVFREFGLTVSEKKTRPHDVLEGKAAIATAAAAAIRRSSGADVRTDGRVPILGCPRQ